MCHIVLLSILTINWYGAITVVRLCLDFVSKVFNAKVSQFLILSYIKKWTEHSKLTMNKLGGIQNHTIHHCTVWQYWLWSFQMGGTKLERFLSKNQLTKRKLVNFEF